MQNVEAICKIGQSTKKGAPQNTSTGEKGIGFKSVFKVADHVWIQSGPYSFKFDKTTALGMIAPEWAEFPEPRKEGHTSILLELSRFYDHAEVVYEIEHLDPRLMVFLRRLRELHFVVHQTNGIVRKQRMLKVNEDTSDESTGRSEIITISHNESQYKFLVVQRYIDQVQEAKRLGQRRSQIALAFPIEAPQDSTLQSQYVYASLPIRDYGFKV